MRMFVENPDGHDLEAIRIRVPCSLCRKNKITVKNKMKVTVYKLAISLKILNGHDWYTWKGGKGEIGIIRDVWLASWSFIQGFKSRWEPRVF